MAILEVTDLKKHFPLREGFFSRSTRFLKAVDGISFSIAQGATMALVGESGCGKSTTARLLLRLIEPTSGTIHFLDQDVLSLKTNDLRALRKDIQIIFQDSFASLNPRKTVSKILTQPFLINGIGEERSREQVSDLLNLVGLSPPSVFLRRHPHELSGGQRQRIGIARALALRPKLIVADEAVSALDVSVKAQILDLMKKLQRQFNLSYLFITHDLAVVRSLADQVAVMYLGLLVEKGPVQRVFTNPQHPYTQALLSATPVPNPKLARERKPVLLKGDVPSPVDPPRGCRFHTRCPFAMTRCREEEPILKETEKGVVAACFLHD